MKQILLVAAIILGMMSCQKDNIFPIKNTTWENHEYRKTVIEFKDTEAIISVHDIDTDTLMIQDLGTFTQNDESVVIILDVPLQNVHAKIDQYGYLIVHPGISSEAKFFKK